MNPRFEKIVCSAMDPLERVKRLRQLEKILLQHLPRSVNMLTICRIAMQQKFPNRSQYEFHRYVEGDDDDDDDGSWSNGKGEPLIVCIQRPNVNKDIHKIGVHAEKGIFIMSPLIITSDMVKTFDNFIGWDTWQVFQAIPEPFSAEIRKLCKIHHNSEPDETSELPCKLYAIFDIEKAKNLELPKEWLSANLTVRPLEEQDAHEVIGHRHWARAHSEQEIKEIVKTLVSCGLFTEEGEMASYVLQSTSGMFNALCTPEKFRRKGFGHIVMAYVTREVARQQDTYPIVETEVQNAPSWKLMEKVGYEPVCLTSWFFYYPPLTATA